MKPDATIEVRFLTTEDGGREKSISIEDTYYGCPLMVKEKAFDCRLLVKNTALELGKTYKLPIKFLDTQAAMADLKLGAPISLWEGRIIATGKIFSFASSLKLDGLGYS